MYYANVNSGGINKKTILKQEEESRIEDHVNRIAHYEAYQMYRKYYKEILDAISEENCFPDSCSGGGVYLREAILKKVPEITEEQLRMIPSNDQNPLGSLLFLFHIIRRRHSVFVLETLAEIGHTAESYHIGYF